MPLTEEDIQHFYREGYVLVPGLVPRASTDAMMREARARVRDGDTWQAVCFEHDKPEKDAPLHRLLWEPSVVAAASALLGSPARVYFGMLAIVTAHGGHGLPWHQDNQYSHILGGALNTFIALADIEQNMANLWVAPRSHLAGARPSKANETTAKGHRESLETPENGICLPPLKAGDACIFDRCTLHRSLKNESDRPRFAYAAQYQADLAREALTGRRDPKRMRATDLGDQVRSIVEAADRAAVAGGVKA
ncbi:MAG: phytanoyl-CoA dioxygenase family protein [Planctomycetes bacterium]|nr:phytanoyl-CoA dioxygenase family protein [Planctomycetota bacterium]